MRKLAEARAKIEARARERHAREQAEHEAKFAARQANAEASGKKPGGKPPEPPVERPRPNDQINLTDRGVAHHAGGRRRLRPMLQRPGRGGGGKSAGGGERREPGRPTTSSNSNRCWTRSRPFLEISGEPECLLADTGYFSAANVAACDKAGIEPLIAMGRQPHHPPLAERFAAAPEAPQDPTPVEAMAHRLTTPAGQAFYALRKQMPEPVFGIISRHWDSGFNFCCAASRARAANGASSPWPGTSSGYSPASRPDKAVVRRLRRPGPRKRHRRPLQPLSAPNPTPSAAATAKIIRGDHPQTNTDRLLGGRSGD